MKIKKFLNFPEERFRWFEVDDNVFFAQKWETSHFTNKYQIETGKFKLKKKLKIRISKPFFLDRRKKHIYVMNKHLIRLDYEGKRHKQYKKIQAKSFFMEFQGPVPTMYGFKKKKIIKWRVGDSKGRTIGTSPPIYAECEGIWHIGERTLVTGHNRKGFWHVEKKKFLWEKLHVKPWCVFVAFTGWW